MLAQLFECSVIYSNSAKIDLQKGLNQLVG